MAFLLQVTEIAKASARIVVPCTHYHAFPAQEHVVSAQFPLLLDKHRPNADDELAAPL